MNRSVHRALHVVWEYPPVVYGGLARHAEHLTRAQVRAGLDVGVLTLAEDVTAPGRRIPTGDDVRRGVRVRRVRRPAPRTWLDLSHAAAEAETAMAAAGLDLLADHAVDVVHAHDWIGSQAAAVIARAADVPLVQAVHATEWGRQQGRLEGNPTASRVHELERMAVATADAVVVCSAAMRTEVCEVLGCEPSRAYVVPNAVDVAGRLPTRRATRAARLRWLRAGSGAGPDSHPAAGPLVVAAGRLEWEKGFSTLIRTMPWLQERFPNLRVVLAGRGSYAEPLRRLACELGVLDALTMPGWLSERDLTALYAASDVVVVPSRYEPSGLVAREAQAAGAAVIATRVGGLVDVVRPGYTGLQFEVGDVHALRDGLARLITDPARADIMRRAGRAAVAAYTWEDASALTSAVYTLATSTRRAAPD